MNTIISSTPFFVQHAIACELLYFRKTQKPRSDFQKRKQEELEHLKNENEMRINKVK